VRLNHLGEFSDMAAHSGSTLRESSSVRRQALRDLVRGLGADLTMAFTLRELGDQLWVTGLIGEGDPWVFRHFERLDDQPVHRPGWLKPTIPGAAAERFVDFETVRGGRKLRRDAPLDAAYIDADVCDQRRVLLYADGEFIAWVGTLKCGDHRFSASEVATLDDRVDRLRQQFAHARTLERAEEQALPTGVVLDERGEILASSADARTVLVGELPTALARVTRQFARSDASRAEQVVCRIHAAMARLDGAHEGRVLAWLSRLDPPRIDPLAGLAPRVREAVRHAATGATAGKTAEAMNVTENTVRGYLKEAYRALGVRSRVELAERLKGTDVAAE